MSCDLKVLVVEDDEVLRDSLRELLEMSGYVVDTAIHGADALEKIRMNGEYLPSLILLDLNMPVMSGKVFLEKLRAESDEHARIPVVVISAVRGGEVGGIAGSLSKPFGLKDVLELVRSIPFDSKL